MTPELREHYRQQILATLLITRPMSTRQADLNKLVASRGFADDEEGLARELAYLQSQGLVEPEAKLISPAVRRWRITAAGVAYLETEGLA
jgi:hypothetical protein